MRREKQRPARSTAGATLLECVTQSNTAASEDPECHWTWSTLPWYGDVGATLLRPKTTLTVITFIALLFAKQSGTRLLTRTPLYSLEMSIYVYPDICLDLDQSISNCILCPSILPVCCAHLLCTVSVLPVSCVCCLNV